MDEHNSCIDDTELHYQKASLNNKKKKEELNTFANETPDEAADVVSRGASYALLLSNSDFDKKPSYFPPCGLGFLKKANNVVILL